ncbi:MAG: class I SAM-dependent methyltransferase [Bacteriovoracaceae bacterium]|nr:class I SAM-dependent methyltransferase [Bacteriovoracaceae bacterium]
MNQVVMTERQRREKEYYDQYAAEHDPSQSEIDLAPVMALKNGGETRPWNSYWAMYELAWNHYRPGDKLLDFGSGPGDNALRFSEIGFEIEGFDISEANTAISQKLFKDKNRLGNFQVSTAENLPYEDESFAVIAGIDILHHVDIPLAINECRRVLRTGGKAFFREPVEAPLLDWIRNTSLVKFFAPKEASFENHITEDERKLNDVDEQVLRKAFPNMKKHYYFLFARFDKFYRNGADPNPSVLEKLDWFIMNKVPFAKKLAGAVIYELKK